MAVKSITAVRAGSQSIKSSERYPISKTSEKILALKNFISARVFEPRTNFGNKIRNCNMDFCLTTNRLLLFFVMNIFFF